MEKIKKLFEMNDEIRSYNYPIIKILVCLVLFFLLMNRNRFFLFIGKKEPIWITILVFILGVTCIFCIYISIAEISDLHDRCVESKMNAVDIATKQYPVESIVMWLEKEDIMEIEIKFQQDIVKIGCTSDNKWSTNVFFDKVYYCGKKEYKTIEAFKEAIAVYVTDGMLEVISIDGIMQ